MPVAAAVVAEDTSKGIDAEDYSGLPFEGQDSLQVPVLLVVLGMVEAGEGILEVEQKVRDCVQMELYVA